MCGTEFIIEKSEIKSLVNAEGGTEMWNTPNHEMCISTARTCTQAAIYYTKKYIFPFQKTYHLDGENK